jgi:RNA polymerase sigma-70 factor (ECF subfamily)
VSTAAEEIGVPDLPAEFERVFREHYEFVYNTARRITGDPQDAEDVLQTLFLRLLDRGMPEVSNVKAYLYRATVNGALDLIRWRKRHPQEQLSVECLPEKKITGHSGSEEDLFEDLRLALAELRPRAAEIFILRHVHGYSDSEIARLLGTSRGTIAVSLFRTRSRLRKLIRRCLEASS